MQLMHCNHLHRKYSLDYRLYRLGWRCRLHRPLPAALHALLYTLYFYRLGFTEAGPWVNEFATIPPDREFA